MDPALSLALLSRLASAGKRSRAGSRSSISLFDLPAPRDPTAILVGNEENGLPLRSSELPVSFETLGERLFEEIPVGTAHSAEVTERVSRNPVWEEQLRAPVSNRTLRKLMRQFGSLGGGNHFLEIQQDREDRLWVMLHSGSRYLGVQVRDWYVEQGANQPGIDRRLYTRIPHLPDDSLLAADYLPISDS